jgi:hypothetical protein
MLAASRFTSSLSPIFSYVPVHPRPPFTLPFSYNLHVTLFFFIHIFCPILPSCFTNFNYFIKLLASHGIFILTTRVHCLHAAISSIRAVAGAAVGESAEQCHHPSPQTCSASPTLEFDVFREFWEKHFGYMALGAENGGKKMGLVV